MCLTNSPVVATFRRTELVSQYVDAERELPFMLFHVIPLVLSATLAWGLPHHHSPPPCPSGLAGSFCTAGRIMDAHHIPHDDAAERIIAFGESGNNPSAQPGSPGYNCDSNCLAGTPSRGLMQTTDACFQQYALAGHNDSPLNPVSDIIASVRYADARYGSVGNVPGVVSVRAGGAYEGY